MLEILFTPVVSYKYYKEKGEQVENSIFMFQKEAQRQKGGAISLPVQSDLGCPFK